MSDAIPHTVEEWVEALRHRTHEHGDVLSRHEGVHLAEAIRREATAEIVGRHDREISALQKFMWMTLGGATFASAIGIPIVLNHWS